MSNFDKRQEFEKEIRPHLDEIRSWCTMCGIPFFFTACVENNDEKSSYISEAVLTSTTGVNLKDDQLKKHMLVMLGMDVVPKRADLEIILPDPDAY